MQSRYISLLTDFGFKKLLGEEARMDLLVHFLNAMLPNQPPSKRVVLHPNEHRWETANERMAVFDLYASNERGDRIILEVQQKPKEHFKKRAVYYMIFPLAEQAEKGRAWGFNFQGVSLLSMLDFELERRLPDKYHHLVQFRYLEDDLVFLEEMTLVFVELPKFTKQVNELKTDLDRWLYLFRYLHHLDEIPETFKREPFMKLFQAAEIAKMSQAERAAYHASLKRYRDYQNQLAYADSQGQEQGRKEGRKEGRKQGREQGRLEVLEEGFKMGLDIRVLSGLVGMDLAKVLDRREAWLEQHSGECSACSQ
ncbi:Rpn family recombination-promoting nuclease/putative transposase [Pontibacter sp. G13]|uniref:Rpn family recombination-promoting nuclease/putative transposase n=1 Tax=Pontibacter sp. G13 TaxID=3074898 RepID=UPI00288BC339|nr:Rpn family recombination-promoting nuclease/putative transposase [Pontibacter sp. G13]WNJ16673.1 Rpn family recombination-promoting nuclease/putative transposase [Pontibacter sp. G13]